MLALLALVLAWNSTVYLNGNDQVLDLHYSFGLDNGGSVAMRCNAPFVSVWMCANCRYIPSSFNTALCNSTGMLPSSPLSLVAWCSNTSEQSVTAITQKANYAFLMLSCARSHDMPGYSSVTLELTPENPGRNYLSLGSAPLPHVYLALTLIWTLALLVYIVIALVKRRSVLLRSLTHAFIVVLLLCKALSSFTESINYRKSAYGNSPDAALALVAQLAELLSDMLLFASFFAVAKGWLIISPNLAAHDRRHVLFYSSLLTGALVFFTFSSWYQDYYLLLALVLYFTVVPRLFGSLVASANALIALLRLSFLMPDLERILLAKISLLKHMRTLTLVFVLTVMLSSSTTALVPWEWTWTGIAAEEGIYCGLTLAFVFLLRPGSLALAPLELPDELAFEGASRHGTPVLRIRSQFQPDSVQLVKLPSDGPQRLATLRFARHEASVINEHA